MIHSARVFKASRPPKPTAGSSTSVLTEGKITAAQYGSGFDRRLTGVSYHYRHQGDVENKISARLPHEKTQR